MKETYCKFPFKQLAIKNIAEGNVKRFWPCCNMGNDKGFYDVISTDLDNLKELDCDEMFYSPRMEQLRENLKNGIRDEACTVCWKQEDAGLVSHRQFEIKNIIEGDEPCDYNVELESLDITISNECNLRCRMCSPGNSNLLMADYKYFEKNDLLKIMPEVYINWSNSIAVSADKTKVLDWIHKNTHRIKLLKMSGGEPFYSKKTLELLDVFVKTGNAKNTELAFHTNGTQFNDEVIKKIKQFKNNRHTISIDGVDKCYDYIRYPGTFIELEKSLENYFENVITNRKDFEINFVVSSLNVLNIPDFLNWAIVNGVDLSITFSTIRPYERGTSLTRLPIYILKNVLYNLLDLYNSFGKYLKPAIDQLITMIKFAIVNNDESKDLMLKEIILFDRSRNQNYKNYLDSMLVEWLNG